MSRITFVAAAFAIAASLTFAASAQQAAAPAAPGAAAPAPAQPAAQNIRGTITAFDAAAKVLKVKTREGQNLELAVPDTVNVAVHKAFSLADVKPGQNLAVTTLARPDGSVVALNIRPLGATITPSVRPYDLAPGSVMNNVPVEQIGTATASGQTLTLKTPNGTLMVLVVKETTMSQTTPGTRDDLKAGAVIFATAQPDAAGKLTVGRLEVGKDGVDPGE